MELSIEVSVKTPSPPPLSSLARTPTNRRNHVVLTFGETPSLTLVVGLWRGKEVAVKVMPTESVIAEEGYDPKGEAELTKRLSHPNLVRTHIPFFCR